MGYLTYLCRLRFVCTLVFVASVWAIGCAHAETCDPLEKLSKPKATLPGRTSQERTPIKSTLPSPKSSHSEKELMELAQQHLSPAEFKAFSDWYHGQFAEDPIVSFEDQYLGRQKSLHPAGPTRYNQDGERPFDGYLAAKKWGDGQNLADMNLKSFQKLHTLMMSRQSAREDGGKIFNTDGKPKRNSQDLKDSQLGVIRDENVGFVVQDGKLPSGYSILEKTVAQMEMDNPFIKQTRDGFVSYAALSSWTRFRDWLSPTTQRKIQDYRRLYGDLDRSDIPELNQLRREMITELVEKTWAKAQSDVAKAKTREEIIVAVANFQRGFISIHPFNDGNGRVARLLTEKLLASKGLPSPVWPHWGEDIALEESQFHDLLNRSLSLSEKFHRDLTESLKRGEGYESVINPVVTQRIQELLGEKNSPFDSRKFLPWLSEHREGHPTLQEALNAFKHSEAYTAPTALPALTPEQTVRAQTIVGDQFIAEDYEAWRSAHPEWAKDFEMSLIVYRRLNDSLRYEDLSGSIRPITPDFIKTFSKLSPDEATYKKKMESHYEKTRIHRGTPSSEYLNDVDMINLFINHTPFTLGNGVPKEKSPDSILPVMEHYNSQIWGEGHQLASQTIAHSLGNVSDQKYFTSGMSSFSPDFNIAKAWMFHGEAKTGLIITTQRRKTGIIDTYRSTEKLGNPSSIKLEKEAAVIGGTDPEAITNVEMTERVEGSIYGPKRTKIADRIAYNKIRISEMTEAQGNEPRKLRVTNWEIFPDGRMRLLP